MLQHHFIFNSFPNNLINYFFILNPPTNNFSKYIKRNEYETIHTERQLVRGPLTQFVCYYRSVNRIDD